MQLLRPHAACRTLCSTSRRAIRLQATASAASIMAQASADTSLPWEILRVPCLADNYAWVIHDKANGLTTVVDPSESAPVDAAVKARGWKLNYIWNTHHHHDHTGGNLELKSQYPGLRIIGPRADRDRIPGIDEEVGDGDTFTFGSTEIHVFDTPGHTRGHITFWSPAGKSLFPGDTLFALGCGRVFEGTHQQMWTSLSKLIPLPDNTQVYCAHEYTQSNARFAVSVDPNNTKLRQRKADIDKARDQGLPTVPSLLGDEKATNPFLRPSDPELRAQLGVGADVPDWEAFGAIRTAKDNFRG